MIITIENFTKLPQYEKEVVEKIERLETDLEEAKTKYPDKVGLIETDLKKAYDDLYKLGSLYRQIAVAKQIAIGVNDEK